jgi:5S rRNA maturation endonuclease (ribonuclease M5)
MTTAAEILRSAGITTKSTALGRCYATCPQCSPKRKPVHQKLECLGITIDEKGVAWGCNHCNWKGGGFYEPRKGGSSKRNGRGYSPTVAQYVYKQANGETYLQVRRTANKEFPQFHWDGSAWVKGKPKGPKIPYRLPELATASTGTTIYVCEGEKDADNLTKLGFVATTASEGAHAKWDPALTAWFKDRPAVILPDADTPGREYGQKIARALQSVAASVKIVDLYPDRTDGSDVSNWLEADAAGVKFTRAVKDAPLWEPSEDGADDTVAKLARLSEVTYQQQRVEAAAKLGIRVTELDKLVKKRRAEATEDAAALPHWSVEPSSTEVCDARLLDDIEKVFRRYIVLPKEAGVALALWTLHAWTMDAGDISPFLVLVSPTKRCGKTNTLTVLYYLTPRSEFTSNISASALFRYIQEVRPTLIIDEGDSFIKDNEEMRGILNSGHTKTAACVIRNVEVNGEHKPRRFSTWAPKAIATIRALADTLEDRAIVVQLQRKPKAASVVRLRKRDSDEFALLRRQAARWAADNFSKLTDPEPDIPEALNDRAADNWRPLLAIADLAGGHWPRRAREAACLLSGEGHDSTSVNVELLADIRLAFGDLDVIRSLDLVAKLIADLERPWVEWKGGRPLTQKQLAGLLRPFGIVSETVSTPGQKDAKGYKRAGFEEVWEQYCPVENGGQNPSSPSSQASETSKRRNADRMGSSSVFSSVAAVFGDGSKHDNLSHSHGHSDASTDRKPDNGARACADRETPEDRTCAHDGDLWEDLDIPPFLRRERLGPPALGPEGDDLGDFQ